MKSMPEIEANVKSDIILLTCQSIFDVSCSQFTAYSSLLDGVWGLLWIHAKEAQSPASRHPHEDQQRLYAQNGGQYVDRFVPPRKATRARRLLVHT